MGDRLQAARRVEPRGHFIGEALILDEALFARQHDSLLVMAHGLEISAFEASDIGQYQRGLISLSRWIVFGPFARSIPSQVPELPPPLLLIRRTVLITSA